MPSASCLAAYAAASIVPADCGCDGTQTPEIRNSLLAEDPPSGSSPRSPQPAAWPTPPQSLFHRLAKPPLPRMSVDQDHQVSSLGDSHPEALSEPYMNLSAHTAPTMEPRRTPICQCANNPGSRRDS